MEKTAKINEKYGTYGLTKIDDATTLLNHGINDYPAETKDYLANYGMFVKASRTHAATKECPMTDDEKRQAFIDIDQWFMDGCPKREKKTLTPEEKAAKQKELTIKSMRDAVAKGTKAEKTMVENIIAKMK